MCGREGSADAMRVLESNKRRQPETRQQQLLNQESKNTPSLCSFLLRHHSLPSPPQKAGPTACAGMCCSRPAGGGVVQVEWLAQLLRRSFAWPSTKCESDQGNDRHPRHQRTDKGSREQISRVGCCCVAALAAAAAAAAAGACAAADEQTAIITVRCEQLDPTT